MGMFAGTVFDRPPHCERCERLESECECPPPVEARTPPSKQKVRILLERRKGARTVTTLRGLAVEGDHLQDLLTRLKNHCGSGGTLQGDQIELQGDQCERALEFLKKLGYAAKK